MISLSIPLVISLCSLLAPFSAHLNAWNRHLTRKYSTKLSTPGQWPINCEGCKRNQMVLEPANMHSNAHFWGLDIITKIKNRRQAEAYWKERNRPWRGLFPLVIQAITLYKCHATIICYPSLQGHPTSQFSENICSDDDMRSRISEHFEFRISEHLLQNFLLACLS